MSLPRYPEYRDSGVEWLGEVPAHWHVQRLKHACTVFPSNVDKHSRDGESPVRLCNYTDVYYNERIALTMPFMDATASEDQIAKFTLKAGDTIITKDSETADDIAIAAYVPEDLPNVVCGYHLSMVRPRPGVAGAFVKRVFDSVYAKSKFAVLANGLTRVGLGQYALDNIELPFPPPDEQTAIAAFLDCEAAKIDVLISEQEKLIALLAEKRQAAISHAVTQGVDSRSPAKGSGVLSVAVPAHWDCLNLRRKVTSIDQGWSPNAAAYPCTDEAWGVLKISAVKNGRFVAHENKELLGDTTPDESICVQAGDFLITRANTPSLVGDCCVVPAGISERLMLPDLIYRLRLTPDYLPGFLCYFLMSDIGRAQIKADARGSSMTMAKISQGHILAWSVPVPPLEEQIAITAYLDEVVSRINTLEAEAERAIALFKERRSALITAAVTGQIDVRGLVKEEAA